LTLIGIMIMLLNWNVCLNWIEQHPTLFSALSSVGALLSAIFSFLSVKQTVNLRKEDREKFETKLANAMEIAKSNKQQAVALEKLANVLEKQSEILEKRKLDVLVQRTAMYDNPDDKSQLLIDILISIINPTKQIIKINSIIINNDRSFRFIRAVYRGYTDSTFWPSGDIYRIHPKSPECICFQQPKTEPPIYGNIDPFCLTAFGALELILTVLPIDKNLEIPLTFTMEHTAMDPLNPPETVNFTAHRFQKFEPSSNFSHTFNRQ
ncbi:hypothetical protein MCQ_01513, partial [Candidatus Bartonella washoeensis Sb944nv]